MAAPSRARQASGVTVIPADPMLVINPITDAAFVRACTVALERHPTRPDELQAALRPRYPRTVVRPRALSGERMIVWYVYREGHWVSSP